MTGKHSDFNFSRTTAESRGTQPEFPEPDFIFTYTQDGKLETTKKIKGELKENEWDNDLGIRARTSQAL